MPLAVNIASSLVGNPGFTKSCSNITELSFTFVTLILTIFFVEFLYSSGVKLPPNTSFVDERVSIFTSINVSALS